MTAVRRLQLIDSDSAEPARAPAPGVLRVAIATRDMKNLNAHFGSAPKFALYDVTAAGWSFVEAVGFGDTSDESGSHRTEGDDKIGPKVEALAGCHLLFCLAIGGPAAAKVVSARIHPIKTPNPAPISEVLERTRTMLAGAPPPWLRKALAQAGIGADKPDFEED
jgi:nitrogen fixation protein NifX